MTFARPEYHMVLHSQSHRLGRAFTFGAAIRFCGALLPLRKTIALVEIASASSEKRAVMLESIFHGLNFLAFAAPRVRGMVRRIPAGKRGHSLNSGGECLLDNFLTPSGDGVGHIKQAPALTNN
jgi:hypothetical protein